MKTTIDRAGRIVIPKEVRRQAGWAPGSQLEVEWRDGKVEIEPAALPVRLERRGHFVVAVPLIDVPPLAAEQVEATREQILREREASF
jgi:AbrB family looped-hinge helix DNA binding protein